MGNGFFVIQRKAHENCHWSFVIGYLLIPITNYLFPHYQLPITYYLLPIPHYPINLPSSNV
jgi:hypothetical protein